NSQINRGQKIAAFLAAGALESPTDSHRQWTERSVMLALVIARADTAIGISADSQFDGQACDRVPRPPTASRGTMLGAPGDGTEFSCGARKWGDQIADTNEIKNWPTRRCGLRRFKKRRSESEKREHLREMMSAYGEILGKC